MRSVLRQRLHRNDAASVILSGRIDFSVTKFPALPAKLISQHKYDDAGEARISFNYLQKLAYVLLNFGPL